MAIDYLDSSCEANIAENFRQTNAAIEGGGGGGGALVVNITYDEHEVGTCDKTAAEMWAAYPNLVVVWDAGDGIGVEKYSVLDAVYNDEDGYSFAFYDDGSIEKLVAADADDYPATSGGDSPT